MNEAGLLNVDLFIEKDKANGEPNVQHALDLKEEMARIHITKLYYLIV